jgi:hypothetical protein
VRQPREQQSKKHIVLRKKNESSNSVTPVEKAIDASRDHSAKHVQAEEEAEEEAKEKGKVKREIAVDAHNLAHPTRSVKGIYVRRNHHRRPASRLFRAERTVKIKSTLFGRTG